MAHGGVAAAETSPIPQIWDRVVDAGKSVRAHSMFNPGNDPVLAANQAPKTSERTDIPDAGGSDQTRFDGWMAEFRLYVASGTVPAFETVWRLNDHTKGTSAGSRTPEAMVSDNDYTLGELVDAVPHSSSWSSTAIFVVEDDAQDGQDHVDAQGTLALAISPYAQRGGYVDSTLCSQASMLHTMELILGAEPLTQFDVGSWPVANAFTDQILPG